MSVYFATCREIGVVKIGNSHHPDERKKELQTGCPYPVVIEAAIPGGLQEEKALHSRYAEHRVQGEWFRLTPLIEETIRQAKIIEAERRKVPQVDPPGFERSATSTKPRPKVSADPWAVRHMKKLEAAGDICFPFRSTSP